MNSRTLFSRLALASGLSLASLALTTSPASAHRFWLVPSATTLSGTDQTISFDGAISNDLFNPDHVAMPLEILTIVKPDGSQGEMLNAAKARHRSTFDVAIDQEGTWWVGVTRQGYFGSFKLNGEEWRVGGRGRPRPGDKRVDGVDAIPEGASDIDLTENFSTNGTFVTSGIPDTDAFTPTGKGLELQPLTHPDDLVANEPGRFRFLIDGKPAAGVKVTAVPGSKQYRSSEMVTTVETGADGIATIAWPTPGMYWIDAQAEDANPAEPRATKRRMGYTFTAEVVAP
ncbi:MAG: DUF4198 domain-containing protein [Pseudomonadota bacterium]|nr:DUF4198 domain-containing protein [Pseudomonadota bacterium]